MLSHIKFRNYSKNMNVHHVKVNDKEKMFLNTLFDIKLYRYNGYRKVTSEI